MFFYFYDIFINQKRFIGDLSRLENRLIELGINGRIEKFSLLKNMGELLQRAIKEGAHTIVAVGDDQTFLKILHQVVGQEVVLGYIPLGEKTRLGELFGLTDPLQACDTLSKRLIRKIDLGKVNNHYWLGDIKIESGQDLKLQCDGRYSISTTNAKSTLSINNLGDFWSDSADDLYPIDDGRLDVVVTTSKKTLWQEGKVKESVFPVKKIFLSGRASQATAKVDNELKLKMPLEISIKPKFLKIIMGKDRQVGK